MLYLKSHCGKSMFSPDQPALVVIIGMSLFQHFKIQKLLSKPINLRAHFMQKCDLEQYAVINKANFTK